MGPQHKDLAGCGVLIELKTEHRRPFAGVVHKSIAGVFQCKAMLLGVFCCNFYIISKSDENDDILLVIFQVSASKWRWSKGDLNPDRL